MRTSLVLVTEPNRTRPYHSMEAWPKLVRVSKLSVWLQVKTDVFLSVSFQPHDLLTSAVPHHNGPEPQAVAMATRTAVPRLVSFVLCGVDTVSQRPGADQRGGVRG